ncbi:MAG: hypothetical protein D6738_02485 [Acidobacteria bacterium]|nr:MAG: hypothetical protein D6738_02485 [Acidobacteriota bacterium]
MVTRHRRADESGSALVAVVVVSLLVGAVAAATWQFTVLRLAAARARVASTQAAWLARGAVRAAAAWFEAPERGALVAPPPLADLDRSLRRLDPDGDGAGPRWDAAPDPADRVRYREGGGAPFRPPDGPSLRDRFVGTPDGPDALLARADPGARAHLEALSRALDPDGRQVIARIALFGPVPGAEPGTLATVEVTVEMPRPPWGPVRAAARGDAVRVDWGRTDRVLVVSGDAAFTGDAGWRGGEAVIAGDLDSGGAVPAGWPGGVPWAGPDRPLRDDADGDGTADDADADGTGDLAAWRAMPGAVPDPWWRGRVGGGWTGVAAGAGPCRPAIPFGPRAVPPRPPSKSAERSGLLVGCAPIAADPLPGRWRRVARRGVRGAVRAVEDPARPGLFRRDGTGPPVAPSALLPEAGGVLLLERAPGAAPLALDLDGGRGAILVDGDATVGQSVARARAVPVPAALRDTGGEQRPGARSDDALELAPAAPSCTGWSVGPWQAGPQPPGPAAAPCPSPDVGLRGLLAVAGRLVLRGPVGIAGQVRAAALEADGLAGPVSLVADGAGDPLVVGRPGPPGAPRVVVSRLRER